MFVGGNKGEVGALEALMFHVCCDFSPIVFTLRFWSLILALSVLQVF